MEAAKKKFEQERTKILGELPETIKDMFGQIGFGPREDHDDDEDDDTKQHAADSEPQMIPVMIVSPYDVPPRPVRDVYWFDLFSKHKRSKTLKKMAYLIYHYGSDDPDDCYSFLEQDDFVSYEEGLEKGYGNLPDHLQTKVSEGSDLTEHEALLVRGYSELKEDSTKEPAERKRGVEFQERHEKLATKEPPAKKAKLQ